MALFLLILKSKNPYMRKKLLLFSTFLALSSQTLFAQISGVVYRDYNANGTLETSAPTNEPGVAGVIINAYDANNTLLSTATSANDGSYSMPFTDKARVEFIIPAGLNCVSSNLDFTGAGVDGNNVRFVGGNTSNLNFGVSHPNDFIKNTNPFVFVPVYTAGDPLGGGNSGSTTGFVGYELNSTGTPASSKTLPQSALGTVWGGAYSKQAQRIFTAAFMKRQVGMGPMGSGGIYMLEPTLSSFNVTQFYDMDANGYRTRAAAGAIAYGAGSSFTITGGTTVTYNGPVDPASGFPEGLGVIGTNVERGLPASRTADCNDPAAFDQVGKVSLGDIEISDNGKFLFVMNLYDRKLYRLELDNAYAPTSVIAVTSYTLPTVAITNGELRPFAVSYHRGKVYVGAVASGENGGSNTYLGATDLYAFVFELNDPLGAASFNGTPVMNFPLNYLKGYPILPVNTTPNKLWHPWSNNTANTYGGGEFTWSSAMLSNIEFTDRGDMILDFFDRGGHQYEYANYKNLTGTTVSQYDVSGDILIAGKDCNTGSFTLENNGSYNSNGINIASLGVGNTEGPGGGEFFYQEVPPDDYHHETSMGSLAILPGARKGIFALMDATTAFSGGTGHFSTETGIASNRVLIYDGADGTMSKANGLGDLELAGDEPDVEIGNRVWKDLNKNGIQDAHEPSIPGMQIGLFEIGNGSPIATATTDADGLYKFSTAVGTNTSSNIYNLALIYDGNYEVKVIGIGAGLNVGTNLTYTSPVIGETIGIDNTGATLNNSDAFLVSNIPTIPIKLGKKGENNPNYDFGFTPLSSSCANNLLLNPSFEESANPITYSQLFTPSNWNASNAAFPELNWATTDSVSYLALSSASPLAYQNVPVLKGYSYNLSFYSGMNDPQANDGKVLMQYYDINNNPLGTAAVFQVNYDIESTSSLSPAPDNISLGAAPTNASYVRVSIQYNGPSLVDFTKVDAICLTSNPPAQLGNYVWVDNNKDGIQDANEVGIAGITVSLFDNTNALVSSTITDAYGYYKFKPLGPGTYSVGFTLPANYEFTMQNAGGNDELDSDVDPMTGKTSNYILAASDSNMSVDAGIYFTPVSTAKVGNFVWYDLNKDGIQNVGETGISGVTVSLYNIAGALVATTITNADGFYCFSDVIPGTYSVGFSTPPGLVISPNNGTVDNPSNSDANPFNGMTSTFTVVAGDNITYVDAGMFSISVDFPLLGGLGDKVWYDVNQNGIQEANESGVPNVTVTLYQADGITVITSTKTDGFGNYVFNNLTAGQYIVGFSDLPISYTFSPANVGTDSAINSDANIVSGKTALINLAAGQYNMTYDAGIYNNNPLNNNSIGDFVWNDINKNGIQDIGETGVAGITVTLYDNLNNIVSTTSTDANGFYLFPDLPNGTYYVGFSNLPPGYVFSTSGQGTPTTDSDPNPATGLTTTVTLVGGTNVTDLDAGINIGNTKIGKGTLGDRVWYDMNNNGLQDAGEAGVAGITVTLYASDGITVLNTTQTNALGNYIFTNLDGGTYIVGFTNIPVGFTISTKDADAQGINGELNSDVNVGTQKTDAILLGTGEDKLSVDMGIVPPIGTAALGNFVWFDLNNDGLQTLGEPGVQGVMVTLYNGSGNVVANTITDGNGEYHFVALTPGVYNVEFSNLPVGYNFTTYDADALGINGTVNSDADVINGLTQTVTLNVGDNNLNLDAGIVSTTIASVGDYVWFDANHDGLQDLGESGIGGVLVTLYDALNVAVASTLTKADGSYIFTNVTPGTYTIGFSNIPVGMVFTTQGGNANANDDSNVDPETGLTSSFTVLPGTHNPTIDAGLYTPVLAGLGNYVWHDVNENGLQDGGEPGVAGVLVTLYASDGITVIATATTDGNGAYSFTNLQEGTYIVGFSELPIGATRTQLIGAINDATNSDLKAGGQTDPIALPAGIYNPNIDAGIYYGYPLAAHQLVATIAVLESEDKCNVNWFTSTEVNTKNFDIERSIDGKNFIKVGTMPASGNTIGKTNYNFRDDIKDIAHVKLIYYRIRLNDIDDNFNLSNIVTARPVNDENILVYPSAFENTIFIEYTSADNSALEIVLTDVAGKTITKQQVVIEKGFNKLSLRNLEGVATGNYYIKIINQDFEEKYIIKVQKK
jgi:protocatechuate 3,4-dioxygenase beta subunit